MSIASEVSEIQSTLPTGARHKDAEVVDQVRWLNEWASELNRRLVGLLVEGKGDKLSRPVVRIRRLNIKTPGVVEENAGSVGGSREVVVNDRYLVEEDHVVLEIVLHQLVHLWQISYGTSNKNPRYHNAEFSDACEELGILVNTLGIHNRVPGKEGKFAKLLASSGVATADDVVVPPEYQGKNWWDYVALAEGRGERKGKSILRKWTCGCQNVRVGAEHFYAACTRCGNNFELAEHGNGDDKVERTGEPPRDFTPVPVVESVVALLTTDADQVDVAMPISSSGEEPGVAETPSRQPDSEGDKLSEPTVGVEETFRAATKTEPVTQGDRVANNTVSVAKPGSVEGWVDSTIRDVRRREREQLKYLPKDESAAGMARRGVKGRIVGQSGRTWSPDDDVPYVDPNRYVDPSGETGGVLPEVGQIGGELGTTGGVRENTTVDLGVTEQPTAQAALRKVDLPKKFPDPETLTFQKLSNDFRDVLERPVIREPRSIKERFVERIDKVVDDIADAIDDLLRR